MRSIIRQIYIDEALTSSNTAPTPKTPSDWAFFAALFAIKYITDAVMSILL